MTSRTHRVARAVLSLAVLIAVVAGVPALLASLSLVPTDIPSLDEAVAVLGRRDDGQLLRLVLGAVAWVCWLLFTSATVAEVVAVVLARPAVTLPGLRSFQRPAAALVTAVALGLTLAPAAAGAGSADRPPLPTTSVSPSEQLSSPTAAVQLAYTVTGQPAAMAAPAYQVQRRDTLWGIAERHLGDPLRYSEIVRLNPSAVGPDNRILPGTTLVLPSDAVGVEGPAAAQSPVAPSGAGLDVTVEQGDTLWGITEATTGDGANWPAVWETNVGRAEPGGGVLDDPDLLRPGWTITVPAGESGMPDAPAPTPQVPVPEPPVTQPAPSPGTQQPEGGAPTTESPAPTSSRAPSSSPPSSTVQVGASPTDRPADAAPSAVALIGGGTLMAGVSLLAMQRYRRRQMRHRRPSRLVPGTPTELVPVERALVEVDPVDAVWLDRALRSLTHAGSTSLPDVIAVSMKGDVLILVLATAAGDAPAPWVADLGGHRWCIGRDDELLYDEQQRASRFAPFPTLVSVGSTDDGEHWLLDLERIGVLDVVGDSARGDDLVRFLAAELAHNTWSEMLNVTAAGLGAEIGDLNPDRLAVTNDRRRALEELCRHQTLRLTAQKDGSDALADRSRAGDADAWAPKVVLLGADAAQTDVLPDGLGHQRSRTAVAVVRVGVEVPDRGGWRLNVDARGRLSIPALDVELRAHQLPRNEAGVLAQLLVLASDTQDRPIPAARGDKPWDRDADACGGAVRAEDEAEAPSRGAGDPGEASLLPLPIGDYLRASASTERDIEVLAPVVSRDRRAEVEAADPSLDTDLADWTDDTCTRPKLTLLGPVGVRAQGSLPERNPRRSFYTEIVAYLATRPGGATSEQYATAIWPNEPEVVGKTKVRQAISVVRAWLGADPGGADYLPSGLTAAAGGRYRITDILIDADLFRRLRIRGTARGAEGIDDLQAALDLVVGRPVDVPGPRTGAAGGYSWLIDDAFRLDHELSAMVVDVAHLVATHHLGSGEPDRAAAAAQVALRAGSFEDVPLLDLVAACDALGRTAEAGAYVQRILFNHDAEVEEDLPPRTAEILFRRERGQR
jgi:nucleoid-associated protein YgaU